MKKTTLLILIGLAIYFFPLDANILFNKIVGMETHMVLFILFAVFIWHNLPGKLIKDKINYVRKCLK